MELNLKQFKEPVRSPLNPNKSHSSHVASLYPQLSEALTLSLKQARLAKLRKEIGEN